MVAFARKELSKEQSLFTGTPSFSQSQSTSLLSKFSLISNPAILTHLNFCQNMERIQYYCGREINSDENEKTFRYRYLYTILDNSEQSSFRKRVTKRMQKYSASLLLFVFVIGTIMLLLEPHFQVFEPPYNGGRFDIPSLDKKFHNKLYFIIPSHNTDYIRNECEIVQNTFFFNN
ncbi:hypothetical protein V1478_007293 [Vespula squamosa]|uniref:Uncharacterized protein n=1 Tax=Vespula squamosa TaxID=30214 RepID=A0ABD2B2U9_VESSQ